MSTTGKPSTSGSSGEGRKRRVNEAGGVVAPKPETTAAALVHPGGGGDTVPIKFTNPGDAPASTTNTDLGGPKLANCRVNLIFWGSAWNGLAPGAPAAGDIVNDCASIIAGPYLTSLTQYNVFNIFLGSTFIYTGSQPPNPFNSANVGNLVLQLIDDEVLPEPDEETTPTLHCVFLPPGVAFLPPPGSGQQNGFHTFALWNDYDLGDVDTDQPAHFAWVKYGARPFISSAFSHELAEALTDPEGNAIQVNPTNPNNWNEIGDVCASAGVVNGVTVQSYWSQQDGACVIPVNQAVTRQITCIKKINRHDTSHPLGAVGGIDQRTGLPFTMSQLDVIKEIDAGNPFFVVGSDGSRAVVGVFTHFPPGHPEGKRYIATLGDNSKADNLLSLPECPG